jgi:hypothetical protein
MIYIALATAKLSFLSNFIFKEVFMYIDLNWSFSEAMEQINKSYKPGGQFSGPARNQVIEQWGQLVGRKKATLELNKALKDCGTKTKFYSKYQISASVYERISIFFTSLPENRPQQKRATSKYTKVDLAYAFLVNKERVGESFNIEELAKATNWKIETCKTYPTKRWHQYVERINKDFTSSGFAYMSLEEFRAVHSQKLQETTNLSSRGILIDKAKEFALLAVSTYNNPFTQYKTYGFIVNIVIAYTALFHAIFTTKGINFSYLGDDGYPIIIDGEEKAWELSKCCKHYWLDTGKAEIANVDFIIGLRNKIEHRSLPAIDLAVAGECQSALSNFEMLLIEEFGDEHSLCANLAIAMQLTRISEQAQIHAMKQLQRENYRVVREYMETFKKDLSDEVFQSQQYRLRAFLVPKLGNHAKTSDLAIDFVNVAGLTKEQVRYYEQGIAFIKGVESPYKLKPRKVVAIIEEKYPDFNMHMHTRCWKYFDARPQEINSNFKGEFAAFVEGFDHYLYTKKWVDHLKATMNDKELIEKIKT